ncbi:MAG: hypothetical protein ACLR8A_06245 [Bacteroides caccae]
MAACSNDEEMAAERTKPVATVDGREAYMSVSVAMPKSTGAVAMTKSAVTRAPGENDGTADEQNVKRKCFSRCLTRRTFVWKQRHWLQPTIS